MIFIKKLTFAPLFLILFALTNFFLAPILNSPNILFSFSIQDLIKLILLSSLIFLSSVSFTVFSATSQDWRLVVPISLVGAILPPIFIPAPLSYVLIAGFLISVSATYPLLSRKLKTYLTFDPNVLLSPSIKSLALYLILTISFAFYLSMNMEIKKNGFQIPDSLIDSALNFAAPKTGGAENIKGVSIAQIPSISQEQIDLLKQNPALLKKYGVDPKTLDSLPVSSKSKETNPQSSQDLTKQLVKGQIDSLLKPYLGIIPAILAVLLFFVLQPFVSILSIFISPILWFTFWILEKSGFVTFTKEMREVKKMVV